MFMQTEETRQALPVVGRLNRRRFLQAAGVTAGAATTMGLAGCGGVFGVDPSSGPTPSLSDTINFALNLEYLQASFYAYVTTGRGLSSADTGGNPGQVTGGAKINFSDPNVLALAQQLAADELAHVRLIRTGLSEAGIAPVSLPALNLAALGAPTNDAQFLALARQLETTGVSAYEGTIQYLVAQPQTVVYTAAIHDAEGQHEAALRMFCIDKGVTSLAVDRYDRSPALGSSTIFNTNPTTGLNTARNISEVLMIVYGAAGELGVTRGGFFPNGVNGAFKTT